MLQITPNSSFKPINFGEKTKYSQDNKDNPGFFKKSIAGTAGLLAVTPLSIVPIFSSHLLQNQMVKLNKSLSSDAVKSLNEAGNKILKDSGLEKQGVEILRKIPMIRLPNIPYFPKKINKILKSMNPLYQFKMGRNAVYNTEVKKILVSNKIALSQFHELGHAMNDNFGKVGKFLQNIRKDLIFRRAFKKTPLSGKIALFGVALLPLVSIFKNKKAEGEKPKGIFDRTTTFIKNNVGKLTFLTMLPIVAEEALASYKGEKAVKNLINKDLFKKVKMCNRFGLMTYVTISVVAGFSAMLASKIRDKIAQPNLNKNNA